MSLPYTHLTASDASSGSLDLRIRPSSSSRTSNTLPVGSNPPLMASKALPPPPPPPGSRTMPHYGHKHHLREDHHQHRRRPSNCKKEELPPPEARGALDFTPESLAAQLTITDQLVFRAIMPDELNSCSWNKKNKLEVAPNVVALTRRFNHVSFWTIEEVLKREGPKQRGEVMAHFVRIAKRLQELNNLHSEFAILSALQSAPLYRLNKTWSCLPRKERQTFEKLTDLFSDTDNFARLREHMDAVALKHQACVPYLGLYLTDLVYIDMAHPHSGGMEPPERQYKMNNILRIVAELQQLLYSNLSPSPESRQYLESIRYIVELQKFVEDDQWKRSLLLEPDESSSTANSSTNSKDSVRDPNLVAELNLSPAKGMGCISQGQKAKFVPGHRKSRSEGGSLFFTCGRIVTGSTDTVSQSGKSDDSQRQRHHLLDDSLIDSPAPDCHSSNEKILCSDQDTKSQNSDMELRNTLTRLTIQSQCVFQSMIRRKALIKGGKRLTMSGWQRYWIELWGSSLVYYAPKTITKSSDRKDYKSDPCKCQTINGWFVMVPDSPQVDICCFQLTDPVRKNVYKFRAPSIEVAQIWIHSLQEGTQAQLAKVHNTNLISFE